MRSVTTFRTSSGFSSGRPPSGRAATSTNQTQSRCRSGCGQIALAGVWAYHADRAKHIIEKGDIEAAVNAASAVGDDHLQRQTRGTVMPDAFTHGSSAQRVRWFKRGLEGGRLKACDTFAAAQP